MQRYTEISVVLPSFTLPSSERTMLNIVETFLTKSNKNGLKFTNLLMEQFLPSYPGTQLQLKSFISSVQVPPCSHGFGEHSSISGFRKKY